MNEKQWIMDPETKDVIECYAYPFPMFLFTKEGYVPVVPGDDQSHWISGHKLSMVVLMDNEIRERLHNEMAPCDDEVFFRRYQHEHFNKYDEFLTV